MTLTQLNLANKLNDRIQKLSTKRAKYKKAFDITTENIKNQKDVIIPVPKDKNSIHSTEEDISNDLDFFFPSEEFAEFLEHKIIKIDIVLENVKSNFKEL